MRTFNGRQSFKGDPSRNRRSFSESDISYIGIKLELDCTNFAFNWIKSVVFIS